MVEKELLYNYGIVAVIAIIIISCAYIFVFKPATDKTQAQKNFEEGEKIFLSRYCENLGFNNYALEDIGNFNGYCFTQNSPMVRLSSYFRLGWEQKNGNWEFFVLQEKR
jgi:hypothetical protein